MAKCQPVPVKVLLLHKCPSLGPSCAPFRDSAMSNDSMQLTSLGGGRRKGESGEGA